MTSLLIYFALAHQCDTPILEALKYSFNLDSIYQKIHKVLLEEDYEDEVHETFSVIEFSSKNYYLYEHDDCGCQPIVTVESKEHSSNIKLYMDVCCSEPRTYLTYDGKKDFYVRLRHMLRQRSPHNDY